MILQFKNALFALAVAALLTTAAHANIAPSSKPVDGENQMFPNAPAPRTQAANPAASNAPSPSNSNTAGVASAVVVAAANSPASSSVPSAPQPPLAWVFIISTLSVAGLALSTRLVLRT